MIRESQPLALSGEIVAGDSARPSHGRRRDQAEFEDAIFETLPRDAGEPGVRGGPDDCRSQPRRADGQEPAGLDVLRDGGTSALATVGQHFRQTGGPLFWGLALALVVSAFWISGGHALVFRNTGPALVVSDVRTRLDRHRQGLFMLVNATVENRSAAGAMVPPVMVDVAAADGTSRRFRIPDPGGELAPGALRLFSARFPAPRNGVESISVRLGSGEDT